MASSLPLLLLLLLHLLPLPALQQRAATPTPPPAEDSCVGVFLSYTLHSRERIFPHFPAGSPDQPYSFRATATVLNTDSVPFPSWSLLLSLRNRTVLVALTNAVPTDAALFLPLVLNSSAPLSLSGFPNTDLKTAIETAGDRSQIEARLDLTGTDFGDPTPPPPTLSLGNAGFRCATPTASNASFIHTCCVRDPAFRPNTSISTAARDPAPADLSITFDVLQSFDTEYLALVTLHNQSPLGRLDAWRLRWTWMRDEFIRSVRGAHTTVSDASDCIFGPQGRYYKDFDFSSVENCERSPTIVDLPISMYNNSDLGRIPFCCRNGTVLPAVMDESQSRSAFQLTVKKMPPNLNRTDLAPPQNWQITGSDLALNPTYNCSPPVRVTPSQFPDPSGLPTYSAAIVSWQVVCNITRPAGRKPRCCVSFSGFYNDSVVPCRTCACGCSGAVAKTCSVTAPAMLLPPEALLVPFDNRTAKANAWAEIKHYAVPNPPPCGDFCGVSINWHVYTDYRSGWSARMTLFNWEDQPIVDWFAAVTIRKAYDGYENMYSFNGSAIGDGLIFMKGLPGLNYLVAENAKVDPRDPGKLQSVISFTKKSTPGINVVGGDGFPSRVIFNGEECSLPDSFPANHGARRSAVAGGLLGAVIAVVVPLAVLMGL